MLAFALCPALLSACGNGGGPTEGYPPAGEMRVVSMERIEDGDSAAGNLIRNGDFHQWWAGAPVPNGFAPPDEAFASIQSAGDAELSAMIQSWNGLGEPVAELNACLRATSDTLEKGRDYVLETTVLGTAGRAVTLNVWQQDEGGDWKLTNPGIIVLQPSTLAVKTYRASFTAVTGGPATVSVASVGTDLPEDQVAWLEWRLEPATGAES